MTEPKETTPPGSGEVDRPMRVIVCSRRIALVGEGDVVVAHDLAELLIALDEQRRMVIVVDVAATTIELGFLARLARDFPPGVSVIVQGVPSTDRRHFHEQGVYRAQFEPVDEGVLPTDGAAIERAVLVAEVARKLEREPTLVDLQRG